MKEKLTERQNEILIFIKDYRKENGFPPTLREIGSRFQISSTFGVKRHLDALEKKGYVVIERNASRGIRIIQDDEYFDGDTTLVGDEFFNKIPIVGRVAAGSPILAMENIEGSIIIDPTFTKETENAFALRVQGDSMINAGIFEGDLVIVSPDNKGKSGDVIVAMLDDEVTVKTLNVKKNKIVLSPENDKYNPITVEDKNIFTIIGKVKGVVRWIN
ncbi:MAG: transcriptional repressor LexA [Ignavibacteria bacterium]|nr:MAG: transcriptional repressor LexA [Ignavibacteria bacterium]